MEQNGTDMIFSVSAPFYIVILNYGDVPITDSDTVFASQIKFL